jgi:enediyne biosynthesis thioesterase
MRGYEYRHRVLFEDTNVVGNVYFTRYLSWQGRCREGFLCDHAPGVLEELGNGLGMVTTRCSCDYLGEAVAGDQITVVMRLGRLARSLITLQFEYWREEERGRSLLARGEQQVACVRRTPQGTVPEPVPQELVQALQDYLEPGAAG